MKQFSFANFVRWIMFGAAIFLMASGDAFAKNYLVKNVAAFDKAVSRLKPGDRLVLANKTWRNAKLVFKATGTQEKPITLMAQNAGQVILSGQSNLRISGDHLIISGLTFKDGYSPTKEVISFRTNSNTLANNTRLVQNVIINYNKPDASEKDFWVMMFGQNNQVDHNYFAGKTNLGPTLVVRLSDTGSIQNNHKINNNFFGYRPHLGRNGGETIRVGTSKNMTKNSDTLIESNFFEQCNGEAEIISLKSRGNVVRRNVFLESQGAMVMRQGGDTLVEYNAFFGNNVERTGGVRVISDSQTVRHNYFEGLQGEKNRSALAVMNGVPNSPAHRYNQVIGASISNNTFVDNNVLTFGAGANEELSLAPKDSTFSDNLIIASTSEPIVFKAPKDGVTFSNNLMGNAQALDGFENRSSIDMQRAGNGLLYPANARDAGFGIEADIRLPARDETGPRWYLKPDKVSPRRLEEDRARVKANKK